jgi:hypothetical protein
MAARSSTTIGFIIYAIIVHVVAFAMLVTSIILYGAKGKTEKELTTKQAEWNEIIRDSESETDSVRRLKAEASRGRMSLVSYLQTQLGGAMEIASGSDTESVETLRDRMSDIDGGTTRSMWRHIQARDEEIARLEIERERLGGQYTQVLGDLRAEQDRVDGIQDDHRRTVDELETQLSSYRGEVDDYRDEVNETKKFMDERIDQIRTQLSDEITRLSDRIGELQAENAVLRDQVKKYQESRRTDILRPADEYALVDASVIGLEPITGNVIIGVGRRNKVILGMGFSVYAEPTAIRPDAATGAYPPGKATLEVIRVEDASSVCRVTRAVAGNPIVKGDVVANAIYDPNKTYKFLVYGNFDANRNGQHTPEEQRDVAALIAAWGGSLVDDLSGDLDFLVLGSRPIVPPEPPVDAPIEVLQQYIRYRSAAERYDELFQQAESTSIPILNENRLYTLIGRG